VIVYHCQGIWPPADVAERGQGLHALRLSSEG